VKPTDQDPIRTQVPLPLAVDLKDLARPSRMLNRYLCDVVELLRVGEHAQAVGAAMLLPQIATAVSDPHLQTSMEQVQAWCIGWLEQGPWREDLALLGADLLPGVPNGALQALRLRRHARPSPLWPKAPHFAEQDPSNEPQAALCFALVRATSAWYAQEGTRNTRVQSNLARLAVLR
jgi:hypothetical protein